MSSNDNNTGQKDPYARQRMPPRLGASQPRENDPYRAIRKPPDSGAGAKPYTYNYNADLNRNYQSDIPLGRLNDPRPNSYLPYSHRHNYVGSRSHEPLYIEDDMQSLQTQDKDGRSATLLQEDLPLDSFDYYSDMSPRSKTAVVFPVSDTELPSRTKKRRFPKTCCGFSYRICIPCWLVFVVAVVLIWYFCWPRVPTLTIGDSTVKDGPFWGPNNQPSLQSDWFVNITIDNTANWIPTRINNIAFTVLDTGTQQVVGTGNTDALTIPGRSVMPFNLTMNINYTATSTSDQTFNDLYNACGPQKMGAPPQLNIDFQATFNIWGIVWHPVVDALTDSDGFDCPLS
ncbi:hypothetical protein NQZ79_g6133 [Umbelopsis isabellina]|nr:hypothetical protein NQZ79_g6133 [Umbelopsis isabellina]